MTIREDVTHIKQIRGVNKTQVKMKQKLLKELKKDHRNLYWFWEGHIRGIRQYSTFMNMLSDNHDAKLTPEIEEIINTFLGKS